MPSLFRYLTATLVISYAGVGFSAPAPMFNNINTASGSGLTDPFSQTGMGGSFRHSSTDPFSRTSTGGSFGLNPTDPFSQTGMNSFGLNPTDPFSQTGMNSFGLNPTDPFSQTGMNSFGSNSLGSFPQTGMNSFGSNSASPFPQTSMIGSPVRQNNRINTQNILSSLGQSNSDSSEAAMKSKQNVELLRDHYQRQAELRQNARSNQRF